MLFTRCPGCQTTFRITADTLQVASGAVRCGNCATVFSAYSGLRQDALSESMRRDDEFLSPTLQTQELASIEDLASPELAQDDTPVAATEDQSDAGEIHADASQTDADAEPQADDDARPLEHEAGEADPMVLAEEIGPAATDPVERSSDKLHFEAPVDEWALLLGEIEKSVDSASDDDDDHDRAERDEEPPTLSPLPDDGEGLEPWDIGAPFSLEAWDDTGERPRPAERAGHGPAGGTDSAAHADAEAIDLDAAISAEEIDATLSADPAPELIAALEASLEHSSAGPGRSRRWALGCIALLVVLGVQVVHAFRAPLATQALVGSLLQNAYGLLGIELVPEWDLEQYEITNWAATAGPASGGPGNLRITAQIRNRGPRPQPYPSIQLELKDRWEAVIGRRVFLPREYLAQSADTSVPMPAGTTVPADLIVVDPGLDASGFELDVCLEIDAGRMRCSGDRVFE